MRRADSLEKMLMLGKIEGKRKRGRERMRWLDGITDSMDLSLRRLREIAWHATLHGATKSQMPLGNWTTKASAKRVCSWWEVNQGQEEAMKPRCYLREQIQWQLWAITKTGPFTERWGLVTGFDKRTEMRWHWAATVFISATLKWTKARWMMTMAIDQYFILRKSLFF